MVARFYVFEAKGVHPYVSRVIEKFEKGAEIVYVIGWEDTIKETQAVISYLQMNCDIVPIKDSIRWYYVGKERRLCVALRQKIKDSD